MTAGSFPGTVGRAGVPFDGKGLLDVLGVAAVVIDGRGRIVLWSPQAENLFGYRADEALGRYIARLIVGAEHREEAIRLFGEVLRGGSTWAGIFPVRHKDGTTRDVEFRNMRLTDDLGGLYALGIAADRSVVERVETELALSDRLVSQSPIGLAVLDTALRYVLVNPALERINGVPAALHLGRRVGDMLPRVDGEALEAALRTVLATGEPLLNHQTVGRTPADPDREHAWSVSFYRLEGAEGRVLGVAASVIDVTERHDADTEADRSRRRLALVADASTRVGTTLEVDRTAAELAGVVVPELADIAAVDVLDSVLALRRPGAPVEVEGPELFRALAVKASGPTEALPAADPPGAVAMYGADRLVTRCVHTGRPVLVEHIGPGDLSRIARSPEAAELLGRAGVHSYLAVPLIARGEVLGALDLKRDRNPLPFDGDDVLLATELAARAAVSIDNARWYQSMRNSAVTLQRSLLPGTPPERPGLEVAVRYQPAQASSEVGGDWYDVIPLPDDKTALVVGDVMGSGIDAAATMGRLRTATIAFADLDLQPAQVLRHLDRITAGLEHYIATCLFAVHDPHRGRCRIANAGHLPPVRVPADGPAELVRLSTGVPLGVGGGTFRTARVPFRPGDTLVLYTDGLVETRDAAIDDRLAVLVGLLDKARGPLEETCDLLLRALRRPGAQDDVALLIARSTG
ncbi:SpoIIE family protein phosphatase [Streptomyces sp. NBC_00090]|uniref:SpoIIE family protein phosphatase n=1 Tax=Streptomyces sp. NBC_00090 TaxID=2903619 RepID=UPI00324E1B33